MAIDGKYMKFHVRNPKDFPKKMNTSVDHMAFYLDHPDFFINLISKHYPLSYKQIKKYAGLLNWHLVSSNINIQWNFDLIADMIEYLKWDELTINQSAFKDITLLDVFSDRIIWFENIDNFGFSFSANIGMPWTIDFIKRFENRIDFNELSSNRSVQWTEELIDRYWGKWNTYELAANESIPWSLSLFDKYIDESYLKDFLVEINPRIFGNLDLVEKYIDKIDWYHVSSNPNLPWQEKNLITLWADKINWCGISKNETIFKLDPEFFNKHLNIWEFDKSKYFAFLSENQSIKFDKELIDRYLRFWDWQDLCDNPGVPWTQQLIEHFSNMVYWGGNVDTFITEDQDGNSIPPIPAKHFQYGLISNTSIPWSIDIIRNFESKIDFTSLWKNHAVWDKGFKDCINDDFLDAAVRII